MLRTSPTPAQRSGVASAKLITQATHRCLEWGPLLGEGRLSVGNIGVEAVCAPVAHFADVLPLDRRLELEQGVTD